MAKAANPLETPMMKQYLETKAANPDALLFMRMGDFFEIFLDDAIEAAKILGITLTCRNRGAAFEVPMAGVPHHSLHQHLPKLLAAGKRVAVMDQLEDPKHAQGLVKRGLTRIITAGTLFDEEELADADAHLLVAITGLTGTVGIAALDCASGRLQVESARRPDALGLALARLAPAELLLPEAVADNPHLTEHLQTLMEDVPPPTATLPAYAWQTVDARRWLTARLGVGALDGFGLGDGDDHLVCAAAACLRYADANAGRTLAHVRGLKLVQPDDHLLIDARCRRNLELVRNQRDRGRAHTLLASVDRCRTAPGSRLLADWLVRPLARVAPIRARHTAVQWFLERDDLRADLREILDAVYDLERLLGRVGSGRCHARDLVQLATTLGHAGNCHALLATATPPEVIGERVEDLRPAGAWRERVLTTLVDDPPLAIGEGGMVRSGVDTELDELRSIKADAGTWLAGYQAKEAQRCGLNKLKVGYNKVFGYFIEVGKAHADHLPPDYVRKQTLTTAERFITPELKEYEDKVLGAEDRIRILEQGIFEDLRDAAAAHLGEIQACADALARIDVLTGLAEGARRQGWCRPEIDESGDLELRGSRHPVVEQVLGRSDFVPNDCRLEAASGHEDYGVPRLAIITGPNMAGKSTYIRQVALCVVLAQAGCFVPADSVHLGIVDRLFTRIGAGDELARNMSTFMVEMAETAAIIHNATPRSLVVLDEVGRGTSTFDGLSLAWAITEYIHDRLGCRCLFATHYHELTDLGEDRRGIINLTVKVAEQDDDVVFLHRIEPGAAAKSYGIHVARLAGVPPAVLARASEVLSTLEELNITLIERERPEARDQGAVQLTLFEPSEDPLRKRLRQIKVDDMSPREALELIYVLHREARQ